MRVNNFVKLVCFVAIVVASVVWRLFPPPTDWAIGTVAILATLALTAELMSYLMPSGANGSISYIPYMTVVLLVPNFAALAAIAVAHLLGDLAKKKEARKVVFNVAQLILAYSFSILAYRWLGGRSLIDLRELSVAQATVIVGLPMLAAYSISFAVNGILVSGAIALSTGERTLLVLRKTNQATLGLDVLATPLVFGFAWAYAVYGPMIASLLWVPLLGLRQMNTTNLELAQTNRELLELMIKSIEARDPYTSGHSRRVKEYAIHIARLLNLSAADIEKIGTAALLHDVGKIYDKYAPILLKEDRLSPEEWAVIKEHPADGANLIATMTRLRELVPAVRHHHENWDGTGYPDGLKAEEIPLASRVIMFADTFDAMTTKRPYRGPMGEDDVRGELLRCRGRQFDPQIADRLLASDFWRTLFPPVDRAHLTPRFMHIIAGGSKR